MKATRISIVCVLLVAIGILAFMDIQSIRTPIKFKETREDRAVAVKARLVDLRLAMRMYHDVYKTYTDQPDTLIQFLLTTPVKSVYKEKSLTDEQLELFKLSELDAEKKAVQIIEKAKKQALKDAQKKNAKMNFYKADGSLDLDSLYRYIWKNDEITKYKLDGFRRDTIETNMIDSLYHGRYTAETIKKIKYIPYSQGDTVQFTFATSVYYAQQGEVPVYEITAPYEAFLWDLDKQELANFVDQEARNEIKRKDPKGERHLKPTDVVAGLKIGDLEGQNNGAGNWE